MKILSKISLVFMVPVLVAFSLEIVCTTIYMERFYNFIENTLFVSIIVIFSQVFISKSKRTFYIGFSFIAILLMLFFETTYYLIFNSKFSASSIFILSQTNIAESKEFLSMYLNSKILILFAVLSGIGVYFFLKLKALNYVNTASFKRRKSVVMGTVLIIFLLTVNYTRRENLPYIMAKSYYDLRKDAYYSHVTNYESPYGIFKNTSKHIRSNDKKEVVVIVIGESTSRKHQSLYGYHRNTTPLLNSIKDELLVYTNVISPHASTVETLKKALTVNRKDKQGSLIQLLNSSGYNTYWFSNQNPIGLHESFVSKIAEASKERQFLTSARFMNNRIYDEQLLPYLQKALLKEDSKKIIFIHLQGAHFNYKYRFPKSFDFFKNNLHNYGKTEKEIEVVNAYDNAILYNDFVINSFIEELKAQGVKSSLLYFSDHGEEVYDSMNFAGHNDDIGTLTMFEIPFLLWRSEDFKEKDNIEIDLNRPYMIDHLFHSIAHLCEVENEFVDYERSIFSKIFKTRKRFILKNKDYDSIVAKSKTIK